MSQTNGFEYLSEDERTLQMNCSSSARATLDMHLALLRPSTTSSEATSIASTPMFTSNVLQYQEKKNNKGGAAIIFTQYGLLAGNLSTGPPHQLQPVQGSDTRDPRIFYNVSAPSSVFICGSQGSGKSHTLSCLLENFLVPSSANELPNPLTALVFHYDTFVSDTGGSPCEAAYLSSAAGCKVRVLCPPTNVGQMRRIYENLPNVKVEELRINESDLNTKRMLELMATSSVTGAMPLYIHVVNRILRDLRIIQQKNGTQFDYGEFKRVIDLENLAESQLGPLKQRLETLESFMVRSQAESYRLFKTNNIKGQKKKHIESRKGNDWSPKPGQLTVVDLSCPCVTPEMACSLFNICLSLFLEQDSTVGRVVALDEAHKYMADSAECRTLTESLLSTIRLQRHLGARVIISTQEPTISPHLLDLCSVTIVHRFSSPDWLRTLKKHLAGVSVLDEAKHGGNAPDAVPAKIEQSDLEKQLLSTIVTLRTGEALLFAPSAILQVECDIESDHSDSDSSTETASVADSSSMQDNDALQDEWTLVRSTKLGHGFLRVQIRRRVTTDGGRSVMAA